MPPTPSFLLCSPGAAIARYGEKEDGEVGGGWIKEENGIMPEGRQSLLWA